MDYYFLIITIIDIFVLGIMCVFIRHNEALMLRQRRCFIGAFILIIAISVLELISDIVNNAPISFRWIYIVTNYLGFGLTPAVPICLSFTLAKNRINKNYKSFWEKRCPNWESKNYAKQKTGPSLKQK